jgi:hypothetical protein
MSPARRLFDTLVFAPDSGTVELFISPLHSANDLYMATCPNPRPQNRKRQYAEADSLQDDPPSRLSKKLKSTKDHHSAYNFLPSFYDSLSKVWLTRRALRELDRRNHLKSSTCAPTPAPKPVHKLPTRKELQRFSRHGGPELRDLRGVSLNKHTLYSISLTLPVSIQSQRTSVSDTQ